MKNLILYITCFLIFNFTALYSVSSANNDLQKFKITALFRTNRVPLNREFDVTVSVNYIGEPGEYIITDPLVEKYHNMKQVKSSTENITRKSTENTNQKEIIKNYIFTLKPLSLGQAYFPAVRITVSDKKGNLINELSTQPITITIEEPVIKRDFSTLLWVTGIILIILVPGFFLTKYILKQKKKKEEEKRLEEEKLKAIKTPEQEFSEEFNKISQLKDTEKLSFAINILKNYLQKKFKYNFKDKSSNELINYFQEKKLKTEIISNLKDILDTADMIKVAAEKPDPQKINKILNNIKKLITSLKGIIMSS